jgi:hypothetical protein
MVWLDPKLKWQAAPSGRAGRPAVFSDAAIQFFLTLKCMFGLGLRQATGLAESLLKLAHLDWNVPDYSTLSRRQKTLSVAITARSSFGGLHLLVDSTGVKILGEGEWKIRKHGADLPIASGAQCSWAWMRRPWRSGPSRSPTTPSVMRQCCRNCSPRSQKTNCSIRSALMHL